jgi:type IV secretory pathway VirB10-like protein
MLVHSGTPDRPTLRVAGAGPVGPVTRPPKQARPFSTATDVPPNGRRTAVGLAAGVLALVLLGGAVAFGATQVGASRDADASIPTPVVNTVSPPTGTAGSSAPPLVVSSEPEPAPPAPPARGPRRAPPPPPPTTAAPAPETTEAPPPTTTAATTTSASPDAADDDKAGGEPKGGGAEEIAPDAGGDQQGADADNPGGGGQDAVVPAANRTGPGGSDGGDVRDAAQDGPAADRRRG